jgi:hypothetical protein
VKGIVQFALFCFVLLAAGLVDGFVAVLRPRHFNMMSPY